MKGREKYELRKKTEKIESGRGNDKDGGEGKQETMLEKML